MNHGNSDLNSRGDEPPGTSPAVEEWKLMRYAKLKRQWLLRGWTDEPRTILNWLNGDCRQLSEAMFLTAQACDGQTDFDYIDNYLQRNVLLNKLIAAGIAQECAAGDEIEPCQTYRKADNPYIRSVHWAITGRCNLKCRHCYMESPDGRYGELPLTDVLRIIEQLRDANVHQVELTGGEPFLRPDLPAILAALASHRIAVRQIYSNGVLITRAVLQEIKGLEFQPRFQISFDGCGTHDAMRGLAGTEHATVAAIRLLRKMDFPVVVATSIDKSNINALHATYELMKELAIQSWRVGPPQEIGNWRHTSTGLTWDDMLSACTAVTARWSADDTPFHLQMPGYRSAREGDDEFRFDPDSYDCTSCRLDMSILPDGTGIPCPAYTDTPVYDQMPNLLRQPFSTVWSDSALRQIIDIKKNAVLARNSECAACAEFGRCGGGCRAMAVASTGDLMAVDPQICDMYKSRFSQRFAALAGLPAKAD